MFKDLVLIFFGKSFAVSINGEYVVPFTEINGDLEFVLNTIEKVKNQHNISNMSIILQGHEWVINKIIEYPVKLPFLEKFKYIRKKSKEFILHEKDGAITLFDDNGDPNKFHFFKENIFQHDIKKQGDIENISLQIVRLPLLNGLQDNMKNIGIDVTNIFSIRSLLYEADILNNAISIILKENKILLTAIIEGQVILSRSIPMVEYSEKIVLQEIERTASHCNVLTKKTLQDIVIYNDDNNLSFLDEKFNVINKYKIPEILNSVDVSKNSHINLISESGAGIFFKTFRFFSILIAFSLLSVPGILIFGNYTSSNNIKANTSRNVDQIPKILEIDRQTIKIKGQNKRLLWRHKVMSRNWDFLNLIGHMEEIIGKSFYINKYSVTKTVNSKNNSESVLKFNVIIKDKNDNAIVKEVLSEIETLRKTYGWDIQSTANTVRQRLISNSEKKEYEIVGIKR